jgi:1-deoxy-D-xylulose-5-phosphate reductoisomerase
VVKIYFVAPDNVRFPALGLARWAMEIGGTASAMLNAANEVAVQAFLDGHTNFYGITDCIAHILERSSSPTRPELEEIFEADAMARRLTREYFKLAA